MSGIFGSNKRVKTEAEIKAGKVQDGQSASADARRAKEMKDVQARQALSKRGSLFSLFSPNFMGGKSRLSLGGNQSMLGSSSNQGPNY
tara:strand:+ start:2157 stop:2420 length:264 start_codon:yes stop_codon:yes gene_type:complete